MPGKDPQSLKAVNNNGFFNFSSNADLLIDGGRLHLNCTDQYFIEASTDSVIRNSTGNANVEVIVDHLNLTRFIIFIKYLLGLFHHNIMIFMALLRYIRCRKYSA